jgi:hypothetical protein
MTEPKTLDEIADTALDSGAFDDAFRECIHGHHWKGCYPCSQQIRSAFLPAFRAALTEAHDLGRADGYEDAAHDVQELYSGDYARGRAERDKEWKALFGRGLTPTKLVLWTEATSVLTASDFATQITRTAAEEIARAVAEERKALGLLILSVPAETIAHLRIIVRDWLDARSAPAEPTRSEVQRAAAEFVEDILRGKL